MSDNPADSTPSSGRIHFWLELSGRRVSLDPGTLVVGRSAQTQLVLDDGLVSRRHAQFIVKPRELLVEDLESVNGVFVNGERISGTRLLMTGDRVVIGKQELIVRAELGSEPPQETARFAADTLVGLESHRVGDDSESTHEGDAMELLGGVADKVLTLGRGDEAERILAAYLRNLLDLARRGKGINAKLAERAASYAVKIAAATRKGEWVDYTFDLYTQQRRPLPGPLVDELYTVLRKVHNVDLPTLRNYVAALKAGADRFGPAERFLAQRIEGLERLAAAR